MDKELLDEIFGGKNACFEDWSIYVINKSLNKAYCFYVYQGWHEPELDVELTALSIEDLETQLCSKSLLWLWLINRDEYDKIVKNRESLLIAQTRDKEIKEYHRIKEKYNLDDNKQDD